MSIEAPPCKPRSCPQRTISGPAIPAIYACGCSRRPMLILRFHCAIHNPLASIGNLQWWTCFPVHVYIDLVQLPRPPCTKVAPRTHPAMSPPWHPAPPEVPIAHRPPLQCTPASRPQLTSSMITQPDFQLPTSHHTDGIGLRARDTSHALICSSILSVPPHRHLSEPVDPSPSLSRLRYCSPSLQHPSPGPRAASSHYITDRPPPISLA
ncbi:hypothetical protein OH76DRAFT_244849 [Lentinus brumalis]|uniref:Uncharacterized protein n=1 Tax=Lentinus brumalis TaxID=2498619 RepID=A0A371DHU1_9APHY|nr:hypothetical protein OH76DRAFT_244849 [Polyporus brumalis]